MTEEEFIDYVNQGYNLIPITSLISNKHIDPIDVYESLSDKSRSYLFESLEGEKDWSRYRRFKCSICSESQKWKVSCNRNDS